jgi:hypothetical protein
MCEHTSWFSGHHPPRKCPVEDARLYAWRRPHHDAPTQCGADDSATDANRLPLWVRLALGYDHLSPTIDLLTFGCNYDGDISQVGGKGRRARTMGVPLVQAVPPILQLTSTSQSGQLLVAQLKADAAGTSTVSASYGRECAPEDQTPRTIPPSSLIQLDVTVVAS